MKLAGWLSSAVGLLCVGIVLVGANNAQATLQPLLPQETSGEALFNPAYVYAHGNTTAPFTSAPDTGGSLVTSLGALPYTGLSGSPPTTPVVSGTLSSAVYANDPSNPYYDGVISSVPGALTFVFTLTNNSTTDAEADPGVSRVSFNGWAGGWGIWASEAAVAGGTAAYDITRSSVTSNNGDVIGVNFTPYTPPANPAGNPYSATTQLPASGTSLEIVLFTNATNYTQSFASVVGGTGTASNITTLAPLATPEPGSMALFSIGAAILSLAGWHSRRGRRA